MATPESSVGLPPLWRGEGTRLGQGLLRPRSAQAIAIWLAVWIGVAGNWALWHELARLEGAPSLFLPEYLVMAVLVLPGTAALLALFAWRRSIKPVGLIVLLVAAAVQHYMLEYHIVVDPTMVANVLQTDPGEARDLLSLQLAMHLLLVVAPPALWLWQVRVQSGGWKRDALRNLGLVALSLVVVVAGAFAGYRQLAPLMRNNPQLRYMMNPLATVYSVGRQLVRPTNNRSRALLPITAGAVLGPSDAGAAGTRPPPMLLLVVGETARSDHFGLNGYARDTTPELARRDVLSWRDAHSCGTSTAASVPCMFSHLGKRDYEARKDEYENLLDVLQAAGLAVLWIDNQAGCKGVCDRVPNASTRDALALAQPQARQLCDGSECLDDMLLAGLDQRIAALPPERVARGVVLVMHQMGSHGPAYYRRSATDVKRFVPECQTNELAKCPHEQLINAFDNSIAQTDRMLGRAIDWLRQREQEQKNQSGLLYMSDHGESLGEFGIYLHGMPYAFAPESQKHVPLVFWPGALARRSAIDVACLRGTLDAPLTHDNLYPTVLGLMDVQTPTYRRGLDAFAACRSGGLVATR